MKWTWLGSREEEFILIRRKCKWTERVPGHRVRWNNNENEQATWNRYRCIQCSTLFVEVHVPRRFAHISVSLSLSLFFSLLSFFADIRATLRLEPASIGYWVFIVFFRNRATAIASIGENNNCKSEYFALQKQKLNIRHLDLNNAYTDHRHT